MTNFENAIGLNTHRTAQMVKKEERKDAIKFEVLANLLHRNYDSQ